MQQIALPKKINFEKGQNPNESIITIEPLFPGYGMTLGNSIRRVLLSSLSGAAVVGIKIKGVDHEFMPLSHVKEDVLEIVLNLKKLRLKFHGDEEGEIRLKLSANKKGEVTAANIEKNSQVEVVNPELVIANITDSAGTLDMEIFVQTGRGYSFAQNQEGKGEIGFIGVDPIFSPVLGVGIKVENVRVGKMTNWDKIVLDVKTDGSIEPKEAFAKSINILTEQVNALAQLLDPSQKQEETVEEVAVEEEVEEKKEKKEKKETKKDK